MTDELDGPGDGRAMEDPNWKPDLTGRSDTHQTVGAPDMRMRYVDSASHELKEVQGELEHGPAVFRSDRMSTTVNEVRLSQLLARYESAKAEADAAAEQLKAITDGIKANARALFPHASAVTLVPWNPDQAPLSLTRQISNRLDTKRVKDMLTAEQYRALTKPVESWVLKAEKP